MNAPDLLGADDASFGARWRAMTNDERAALPDGELTACYDRYRKLTAYIDAGIVRLEREQERKERAVALDAGAACSIAYRCVADIEAQPVRWLWPGRIPRGKVSLIVGHAGLGKSQATDSLAAIASTGGTWPVDRSRCERGSVIILSAEDDAADTTRPRLEAAGADLSRVYVLDAVREETQGGEIRARTFNLATDITNLGALFAKLQDVALLVIDPVSAYLGNIDSHKNADVRSMLAPLAELAARHGVAVVCVSHLNKNSGTEALLRVQGSIAFGAAARAVWGVARDKGNPARRLFLPLKLNLGADESGLAFAVEGFALHSGIETSRVVWEGAPVTVTAEEAFAPDMDREDRTAVEEAKEFLADLLAMGPVSSKRIYADAREAGHSERTIRRAQKALGIEAKKDGTGPWLWELPQKMAKTAEDGHTKSVDAFGNPGHLREPSRDASDVVEVEI